MQTEYEDLSREARMRRLAELCSKAVSLFLLDRITAAEAKAHTGLLGDSDSKKPDLAVSIPADAKAILVYLQRVGHASPDEISRHTELSHSTVTRRLRELLAQGRVIRTGKTKAVRYTANGNPGHYGCAGTSTQVLAGLPETGDENVQTKHPTPRINPLIRVNYQLILA